jgi:tetratricopeptide (TPR) repeat protein
MGMASGRSFHIEFNPAYLAEARGRYDDIESAVRNTIPWVLTNVLVAREGEELRSELDAMEATDCVFRAFVSCEVLGQASSRPDVRQWLCEYVGQRNLGEGARYQLAGVYSRLGAEARRTVRLKEAMKLARQGIEAIADLPPAAVTANLYYNLGVAAERYGDRTTAVEAFGDSAEIDDLIGRHDEATLTRQRVSLLQN